jgi:flavin reductase (DIM6/NTAB) family NADH-FMN oxidoreductase RutF
MDANVKKTVLRMIPYGLYVLTAKGKDDTVTAATVNWVTQASFAPPLVVVGVKADSHPHPVIKESKAFALNVLGKDQGAMAFTFFKPATREGQKISGEPFRHHRRAHP